MNLTISTIYSVLMTKIETWFLNFTAILPNLFVAIIIIVIFWLMAKLARRAAAELLDRFTDNGPVARLVSGIVHFCVVVSGLFIALGILNLEKTVSSLLAGAGVVGLAIGFAFQEIASNFIAGILIAFRKPFKVGDIVKVNNHEGQILDIDLRTTHLATFDGLEVIVPNKDMFTNTVTNYTATPARRVDLEVGISYGENLVSVRELTLKALEKITNRQPSRPPEVFFIAFGESSINFKARVWIPTSDPISHLSTLNEMVIVIKETFDQNNIVIPYPIRTLDFGIKAGERLAEVLAKK